MGWQELEGMLGLQGQLGKVSHTPICPPRT